jgi:very-short-patch-repair endonuclease
MAPPIVHPAMAALLALAARQHGVVLRRQLLDAGFTPSAIKHRIGRGDLHPMWRGVYAVGRPDVDMCGRWMAATMICGRGAVLSHESAAELWRLRRTGAGPIHVSAPLSANHRREGIALHRRTALADDVTRRLGIPVTTPSCTLVDLADRLPRDPLEAAVIEADKRGLVDPDRLRRALEAIRPRPGVALLRAVLDRETLALTDSELERRFLPLVRRAGLSPPLTQQTVNGFRVDFHWPRLGLIVETDGLTYHRTPAQQARDRVRDQAHTAAGLTTLRFTHAQVAYEPAHVESVLRTVAERLPTP